MYSGNYPDGAANDPRAPYNQVDAPELEFELEYESTLKRTATIESNEYEGGYVDEEGYQERAIYVGNSIEDYKAQHYTVSQLLSKFVSLIDEKIESIDSVNIPTIVTSDILRNKLNKEKADLLEYKSEALSWEEDYLESV